MICGTSYVVFRTNLVSARTLSKLKEVKGHMRSRRSKDVNIVNMLTPKLICVLPCYDVVLLNKVWAISVQFIVNRPNIK